MVIFVEDSLTDWLKSCHTNSSILSVRKSAMPFSQYVMVSTVLSLFKKKLTYCYQKVKKLVVLLIFTISSSGRTSDNTVSGEGGSEATMSEEGEDGKSFAYQ